MAPLKIETPPADVPRADARGATWIKSKLVAEVAFAEFTGDGRIRHGSFLGLRTDKRPSAVTPEKARPAPAPTSSVKITSRERVIFPESGQTKGELADYYARIASLMLPFAANRPISLVRCPQGRAKKCFFQKHDSGSFGDPVRQVPIRKKGGGSEEYIFVEDADGLLACVQMGTIEFHGWTARADAVEKPDRMIFDLDPDEALDFADVKNAARDIRDHLSDIGLVSFAMLSGGKGVHVIVPLTSGHDWEAHKDFASRFAQALSAAEPDRFVATMSKAKRKGRIFIDWLRNQRGSTAILPYSARARVGAPVAVPISWDELDGMKDAHPFGIDDADELLKRATGLKGWGLVSPFQSRAQHSQPKPDTRKLILSPSAVRPASPRLLADSRLSCPPALSSRSKESLRKPVIELVLANELRSKVGDKCRAKERHHQPTACRSF
jgi:bifunctional non-homologous end joining protein LigD